MTNEDYNKNLGKSKPPEDWGTEETSWDLEEGFTLLYTLSLEEVLGQVSFQGERARRHLEELPSLLLTKWRKLQTKKRSLSTIQRATLVHGLSITLQDPQVQNLLEEYEELSFGAEEAEDRDKGRILETSFMPYHFVHTVARKTSIGTVTKLEGPLSKVSGALGISQTKLIPILCMISLATLNPPRKWLQVEIAFFQQFIVGRAKWLEAQKVKLTQISSSLIV